MLFNKLKAIFSFNFIFFILLSCQSQKEVVHLTGNTMGTYYSVKVITTLDQSEKIKKIIKESLLSVNHSFNHYDSRSEISKINNLEKNEITKVSKMFSFLFLKSKEINVSTNGFFDISIGPLINGWGFGPEGPTKELNEDQLIELKRVSGFANFELKDNIILKKESSAYLDMSAIAKGYGVDLIFKNLKDSHFNNFFVEIGGEVRSLGKNNKNTFWRVGIEKPAEELAKGLLKIIELNNMAMATSGSYRNNRIYNKKVYTHSIDPKSAMPIAHKMISVTVLDKECFVADALATALLTMGPRKAKDYIKTHKTLAFLVFQDNNKLSTFSTLQDYIISLKR